MPVVSIGSGSGLGFITRTQEKTPELKKEFAVCGLLLRHLPETARPPMREGVQVLALGIKVDVVPFVFPDTKAAARAWNSLVSSFEKRGLTVSAVHGEGTGFTGPVLVLKEPSVEERFIGEDAGDMRAANRGTIRVDMEVIGRFSRITGLRVRYCLGQHVVRPPLPPEEGTLNIFISARPPGNFRRFSQSIKEIFGYKMWSDGETRMVNGPTAWRGRLISAEGIPLFQIIGDNAYQLAIEVSDNSNAFDRGSIWEEMLSLLAHDLAPSTPPAETPEMALGELEDCVREMTNRRDEGLRTGLGKIEFELGELQRRFAEKLRERDEQVTCLKALESATDDVTERSAGDFTRLRTMKDDIVAIRASGEEGLMVETVPIALERDGRRYDLGPFRIHISPEGDVTVWSEAPKHPKGHHHPHIDKTSLECFGNITLAVAKLATTYRFADAVEIILRWLRSYRPETTLIPLEEFPSEAIVQAAKATKGASREKKHRAELLPAAQAAGSEGRPSGHADRRGVGGKPRRLRPRQDGGAEARRLGRR